MIQHALSYSIVLACILLSGCAVHTDMTHATSPIDSDSSLQEYQRTCQSMTYAPKGYTVEEDTYIYSSHHDFRPMEQSTLKYRYVRHKNRKLILANEEEINQIHKIYPGIPDFTVQTQYRADLCYDVASDVLYQDHPVVALSQKMNDLYQSCLPDQCAQSLAQLFNGSQETLNQNAETYTLKTHPDTCYLAFLPQNSGTQPARLFSSEIARVQRFRFQYPDIQRPIEGLCTTDSEEITIPVIQTPIVISVARNAFPVTLATYIDAVMPSSEDSASCPNVNRDDEYPTFYPPINKFQISPIFKMTQPHPEATSNKRAAIDCSHPYQWYDYFVHPIPGTLYYYKNVPVVITKHTKIDNDLQLTVISLAGEQFDVSVKELERQPNGKPTLPPMTAGQCQCPAADEIPAEVKSCQDSPKFFDCCEQAIRSSAQFKDEMSLNAHIYHVCRMDQIKAYEIQTIIWTGHDASYPIRSYFTQQNASLNASPVQDLVKEASILTHTYPIHVEDLMAGKELYKY